MRNLIPLPIIISLIIVLGCNSNQIKIPFHANESEAIIVGDSVTLLNNNLEPISTIKENSIVKITHISDSLVNNSKDYCNAFKWVKIKQEELEGILDGRRVYKINSSKQDTSFVYKKTKFSLTTTKFFGIGVADEDGLTFCDKYYEPIILTNESTGKSELIEVGKNKFHEEAYWNHPFKYFELMANDGAYDKIQYIKETKDGVILKIKRELQEGWNHFEINLILNQEKPKATILNYGDIKY
tara:strand:+ start:51 stop:773 length:723 start_codon:yes stop_codon:yes gene_type:complete